MRNNMRRPWVPHKIAYIVLAALHASAWLGADRTVVCALIAATYLILATD